MQPSARVFLITGTDDPKHNATQGRIKSKILISSLHSYTFGLQLNKIRLKRLLNTNKHLHHWGQLITTIDNANFICHNDLLAV